MNENYNFIIKLLIMRIFYNLKTNLDNKNILSTPNFSFYYSFDMTTNFFLI